MSIQLLGIKTREAEKLFLLDFVSAISFRNDKENAVVWSAFGSQVSVFLVFSIILISNDP